MTTMSLSSCLTLTVFYLFIKSGITDGQASCLDGRIRLVNSTVRTAKEGNLVKVGGRVQLCVGSQWTDFCSLDRKNHRRWHQEDIDVACRQLRNENSSILTSYLEASGNVVQAVGCLGYESRLVDCSIWIDTECESRESNISDCELPSDRVCIEGEIQQDNITTAVRLCQDGVWRYVCGEFWTDTSAAVVCRQQDLSTNGSQGVKLSPNESTDPLRTHFSCIGAERTLMECRRIGLQNYTNCSMVAGVKCPSPTNQIVPVYTQGLPPGPTNQTVPGFSPVSWAVGIVIGLVVGAGGTALVLLVVVMAVRKRVSSPVSSNTGSRAFELENTVYSCSSTHPTHIPQQNEYPYAVPKKTKENCQQQCC